MTNRNQEGGICRCSSPAEHIKLVDKVNDSFKRDYDGSRRKIADQVSTSEALRKRALIPKNGNIK